MASRAFWEYSAQLECDNNPIGLLGIKVPHCLRSVVKRCVSGWMSFSVAPSVLVLLHSVYFMHALEGRHNSLWVCDRHLQDEVFRDLKQLRVISAGLQQEGQDIKTALRSFPSQLHADLVTKSNT